jgi:hypothetical protein
LVTSLVKMMIFPFRHSAVNVVIIQMNNVIDKVIHYFVLKVSVPHAGTNNLLSQGKYGSSPIDCLLLTVLGNFVIYFECYWVRLRHSQAHLLTEDTSNYHVQFFAGQNFANGLSYWSCCLCTFWEQEQHFDHVNRYVQYPHQR